MTNVLSATSVKRAFTCGYAILPESYKAIWIEFAIAPFKQQNKFNPLGAMKVTFAPI
jgi:hypothetical protein